MTSLDSHLQERGYGTTNPKTTGSMYRLPSQGEDGSPLRESTIAAIGEVFIWHQRCGRDMAACQSALKAFIHSGERLPAYAAPTRSRHACDISSPGRRLPLPGRPSQDIERARSVSTLWLPRHTPAPFDAATTRPRHVPLRVPASPPQEIQHRCRAPCARARPPATSVNLDRHAECALQLQDRDGAPSAKFRPHVADGMRDCRQMPSSHGAGSPTDLLPVSVFRRVSRIGAKSN